MKRLLAVLAAAFLMLAAGMGVATAGHNPNNEPGPGPNGNNDHGLCTAYFNGQKVGHGDGESPENSPAPFQGLEDHSEVYTDNDGRDNDGNGSMDQTDSAPPEHDALTDAENIFNYCENSGDDTLIGGSPDHGRFTCINQTATDPDDWVDVAPDNDSTSDPECARNEKPGNGDDK